MRISRLRETDTLEKKEDIDLSLIDPVIEKYRNKKGNLIPLLQKTQDIFGYLPKEAFDKISNELGLKKSVAKADTLALGKEWQDNAASRILDRMVNEFGRRGKVHGGGYYEYPEGGKKHIWSGLKAAFAPQGYTDITYQDIKDRLTFCQCLEAVRAMEEGVVNVVGDGNIGSIMGIGFPAQTGGVFQAINAYGLNAFVTRARELEAQYGSDFAVPSLLLERAESGEQFR